MIHLGPAGSCGLGYVECMKICAEHNLESLEVEFTYGVKMTVDEAKRLGDAAKEHNTRLSVHGPYYINLVSKEKEKIIASKKRIIDSCSRATFFSLDDKRLIPIVFHAGFYQDLEKDFVYEAIKHAMLEMNDTISENDWNVILTPETTGKPTQFGDVEELLSLAKETKSAFCVDFAHLLARNNGNVDYESIIKKLPESFHAHYSGINYGPKGEKNHIPVNVDEFNNLLSLLNKYEKEVNLIIESPEPMTDCKKLIKIIRR